MYILMRSKLQRNLGIELAVKGTLFFMLEVCIITFGFF